MAAEINDGLKVFAPKDIDLRRGIFDNGAWRPFNSVAEALAYDLLAIDNRFIGLTIPVLVGGEIIEYWFANGVADSDLIEKQTGSGVPDGGTAGQVLKKNSNDDGDASWQDDSITEIDDTTTSTTTVWSSEKVSTEIGTVASDLDNEITDRVTTDTNLLTLIDSEQTDRVNADNDLQNQITNHKTDSANPHSVTLEQARSVDNRLDGEINMDGNAIKNLPAAVDGGDPVRKSEYDSMLSVVVKRRGGIDLSTNPNFPASEAGDRWEVLHAGKIGGNDGLELEIWDEIVCVEDNAGGDWLTVGDKFYFVQANVGAAAEGVSGTIMLATDAETQAGTNNTKAITALKLANWWSYVKGLAHTFAAKITFTTAPRLSSTTANQYLKVDANKDIESVASIPAADVQESSTKRFASDAEKTTWNGKQDAIGYTPFNKAGDSLTGTSGAGFYGAIKQSTKPSTPTNGIRMYADASGRFSWIGENGFVRVFDGISNTADRTYTLPDVSGTIALQNDASFTTALQFDKDYNLSSVYTITGAVAFTLNTTGYQIGRVWVLHVVANGVNKPTFSSAFDIAWDDYQNVNGYVMRYIIISSGSNRATVDVRRVR